MGVRISTPSSANDNDVSVFPPILHVRISNFHRGHREYDGIYVRYNLSLLEFSMTAMKIDYRTGLENYRRVDLKGIFYSGRLAFRSKGPAFQLEWSPVNQCGLL